MSVLTSSMVVCVCVRPPLLGADCFSASAAGFEELSGLVSGTLRGGPTPVPSRCHVAPCVSVFMSACLDSPVYACGLALLCTDGTDGRGDSVASIVEAGGSGAASSGSASFCSIDVDALDDRTLLREAFSSMTLQGARTAVYLFLI